MTLVVTLDPEGSNFERRKFMVGSKPKRIGRALRKVKPQNDNAIFDCGIVSRCHGSFVVDNNQLYFKDLGSSNGSFLNGKSVCTQGQEGQPVVVNTGDILQFGEDVVEKGQDISCIRAKITVSDSAFENEESSSKVSDIDVQSPNLANLNVSGPSTPKKPKETPQAPPELNQSVRNATFDDNIKSHLISAEEVSGNLAQVVDLIASLESEPSFIKLLQEEIEKKDKQINEMANKILLLESNKTTDSVDRVSDNKTKYITPDIEFEKRYQDSQKLLEEKETEIASMKTQLKRTEDDKRHQLDKAYSRLSDLTEELNNVTNLVSKAELGLTTLRNDASTSVNKLDTQDYQRTRHLSSTEEDRRRVNSQLGKLIKDDPERNTGCRIV